MNSYNLWSEIGVLCNLTLTFSYTPYIICISLVLHQSTLFLIRYLNFITCNLRSGLQLKLFMVIYLHVAK